MEYLNLIWYVLALVVVAGLLVYTLKLFGINLTKGDNNFKDGIKTTYGKSSYLIFNMIGWIIFLICAIGLLGKYIIKFL